MFFMFWLLKKHLATYLTPILLSRCYLDSGDIPKNVFMVFEYLEFDLTGIIDTPEIKPT